MRTVSMKDARPGGRSLKKESRLGIERKGDAAGEGSSAAEASELWRTKVKKIWKQRADLNEKTSEGVKVNNGEKETQKGKSSPGKPQPSATETVPMKSSSSTAPRESAKSPSVTPDQLLTKSNTVKKPLRKPENFSSKSNSAAKSNTKEYSKSNQGSKRYNKSRTSLSSQSSLENDSSKVKQAYRKVPVISEIDAEVTKSSSPSVNTNHSTNTRTSLSETTNTSRNQVKKPFFDRTKPRSRYPRSGSSFHRSSLGRFPSVSFSSSGQKKSFRRPVPYSGNAFSTILEWYKQDVSLIKENLRALITSLDSGFLDEDRLRVQFEEFLSDRGLNALDYWMIKSSWWRAHIWTAPSLISMVALTCILNGLTDAFHGLVRIPVFFDIETFSLGNWLDAFFECFWNFMQVDKQHIYSTFDTIRSGFFCPKISADILERNCKLAWQIFEEKRIADHHVVSLSSARVLIECGFFESVFSGLMLDDVTILYPEAVWCLIEQDLITKVISDVDPVDDLLSDGEQKTVYSIRDNILSFIFKD